MDYPPSELVFIPATEFSAAIISSILDWLHYRATYNYPSAVKFDAIEGHVDVLSWGLTNMLKVSDIIIALNEIRDAIAEGSGTDLTPLITTLATTNNELTTQANNQRSIYEAIYNLCFCGGVDSGPPPIADTDIGTEPPQTLPTGIDTVEEWLCATGHAYTDELCRKLDELDRIKTSPLFVIGAIIAIIGAVVMAPGISITYAISAVVAIGLTAALVQALLDYGEGVFRDSIAMLQAHIGCIGKAFVDGDGGEDTKDLIVTYLLQNGADESLVQLLDIALIHVKEIEIFKYGLTGDSGTVLPDVSNYLDATCECGAGTILLYDFSDGLNPGWNVTGVSGDFSNLYLSCRPDTANGWRAATVTGDQVNSHFSREAGALLPVANLSFDIYFHDPNANMTNCSVVLSLIDTGDTVTGLLNTSSDSYTKNQWIAHSFPLTPAVSLRLGEPGLQFSFNRNGQSWADGKAIWLDNVRLELGV